MSQPTFAKTAAASAENLEPETSFTATDDAPRQRGNPWRMIVVIALASGGLVWAARYTQHLLTHAETDDAYVTSYVHQVNPHIGGTIVEALVDQNSDVKIGDVLFRLDPRDSEAKVRQAEAQLAQSNALVSFTDAEIADAKAKVEQSQAQFVK